MLIELETECREMRDFCHTTLIYSYYVVIAIYREGVTLESVRKILIQKGPLPSSLIQEELVVNHNLNRDAARKQIQRAHESGEIKRFIRLRAGSYMYYLPDLHPIGLVITTTKDHLQSCRPKLARVIKLVDEFKVVSLLEICRLTNVRFNLSKNHINPKLLKTLGELELLGISLQNDFLVYSSLDSKSIDRLVKKANEKFEEEAHLLYSIQEQFLDKRMAREITLYRAPTHYSLVNKFDAIGYSGFRKKATVFIEFYSRRPVLLEDLLGYRERIWSTISKKRFPKPVFCYIVATSFSDSALLFAFEKKMKVGMVDKNLMLTIAADIKTSTQKGQGWHGRLADAKGRAFEAVVEKVFRKRGFTTETRRIFYLHGNEITEKETRHRLTDIDVLASKDEEGIFLIECKSAKKQISRSSLMRKAKDFENIADYLSRKIASSLPISSIIIGNSNKLDILDAKRRARIPTTILSPSEFYQEYKKDLEGEPKWLFDSKHG